MTMVLRPGRSLEDLVAAKNTSCPRCGGQLSRWGQARSRSVRGPDGEHEIRPRRVRCTSCRVTQVVFPAEVLVRRRDSATVVGHAWRDAAAGKGARRVARRIGVPMETVRGWLRRLRSLLQERYGGPAHGHQERLQRGLAFVTAEARRAGCRTEHEVWQFVSFRSQGLLLFNTSWP